MATLIMSPPQNVPWNGHNAAATAKRGREDDAKHDKAAKMLAEATLRACESVSNSGPFRRFLDERPLTRHAIFRQVSSELESMGAELASIAESRPKSEGAPPAIASAPAQAEGNGGQPSHSDSGAEGSQGSSKKRKSQK